MKELSEMMPEKIELYTKILEVFLGSAGLAGLGKFIYGKYTERKRIEKRKKDLSHTVNSFKNIENLYENIINLAHDYDCNYVHILGFHNGGKAMNELSEKKVTIKTEFKTDPKAPKLKSQWKNRDIDFEWFPLLNKILDNGMHHIKDITTDPSFKENNGLRMMYNTQYGKEFLLCKIDWIGDTLVVLCLQREPQQRTLAIKEQAFINYKAKEMVALFSNARYFLEGKQ